jgi:DNA-binding response OmpR family regulator
MSNHVVHHTEHDAEYWWKRVKVLEYAAMPAHDIPPVIATKLSRQRLRILSMLTTGNIISCAQIILTTRCRSNNSTKVHICRIRKELAKHGIEITNVFGVGYWLDPVNLELFRELNK